MRASRESDGTPEELQQPEIVVGAVIEIDPSVPFYGDETFGVPVEAGNVVTAQILAELAARNVSVESVVFSGYYDYNDSEHNSKRDGVFGLEAFEDEAERDFWDEAEPETIMEEALGKVGLSEEVSAADASENLSGYTYFFTGMNGLQDFQEGPIAHAATGGHPAIGVYDLETLRTFEYDEINNTVTATPDQMKSAQLFEFRPTYEMKDTPQE